MSEEHVHEKCSYTLHFCYVSRSALTDAVKPERSQASKLSSEVCPCPVRTLYAFESAARSDQVKPSAAIASASRFLNVSSNEPAIQRDPQTSCKRIECTTSSLLRTHQRTSSHVNSSPWVEILRIETCSLSSCYLLRSNLFSICSLNRTDCKHSRNDRQETVSGADALMKMNSVRLWPRSRGE